MSVCTVVEYRCDACGLVERKAKAKGCRPPKLPPQWFKVVKADGVVRAYCPCHEPQIVNRPTCRPRCDHAERPRC